MKMLFVCCALFFFSSFSLEKKKKDGVTCTKKSRSSSNKVYNEQSTNAKPKSQRMEVKVYSNAHSTLENAPPPPHIHDSLDDDLESGSLLRLGFNPKFESLKQKEVGITLQWSNIKYSVGPKQILNGITGVCEPGNVLAVMGKVFLRMFLIKQNS